MLSTWLSTFYVWLNQTITTYAAGNIPPSQPLPLQQWLVTFLITLNNAITGYTNVTPPPGASPSPSPTPYISAAPTSLYFASTAASPIPVAMSDSTASPTYSASPSPGGVVTAAVSGSTVNVSPVANGSTSIKITDGVRNVYVTASVAQGPLSLSPTSRTFQYYNSATQTIAVTDPGFGGTYSVSVTPTGVANASVAGSTVTLTPVAAGLTTLTVSDGILSTTASIGVGIGPLALSPTSLAFLTPTSGYQTIAITDPGFTGSYTISPSTSGIVSTGVSGNTLTVTPMNAGSTTLNVSDGTNTAPATVTVSPTPNPSPTAAPSPSPTPFAIYTAPGQAYPIVVSGLPSAASVTITAQVKGQTNTAGSSIFSAANSFSFQAGLFNGQANPTTSAGMHIYNNASGLQASPATGLQAATAYTLAATLNFGGYDTFYVCASGIACAATQIADTTPLATFGVTQIGAASDGTRVFPGDIWNVQIGPAISAAQIQAVANSGIPDPYPSATPTPPPYPILATNFAGNSPFFHTIASMSGVTTLSSTITTNWWNTGIKNVTEPYQSTPVYVGAAGQPQYTVICEANNYRNNGTGCDATGSIIHLPSGAVSQPNNSDHHIAVLDPSIGVESDLYGGLSGHTCILTAGTPGTVDCSWGGQYPLTGTSASGLVTDTGDSLSTGDASGYAFGIFEITAQELLNYANNGTRIAHGIGMGVECVSGAGIYPSAGSYVDNSCSSAGIATPNVEYGYILHIKSSITVSSLGGSVYCQAALHAAQDYGAYVFDTGPSYGSSIAFENPVVEDTQFGGSSTNPWYTIIEPGMISGGDQYNTGAGTGFQFSSCLDHTTLADWETLELNQAGDSALPSR